MRTDESTGTVTNGATGLAPVPSRGLLKERAYDEIKHYILSDAFPPGTFLAERQLAAQLGMSKTPVKAALERLELEGFITVSPQQGILVRQLSVEEVADQYEIRLALETYTVRALAGRLNAEQAGRVRANLEEQVALGEAATIHEHVDSDLGFHLLLTELLGNEEILRVMRQMRDKVQRTVAKVYRIKRDRIAASCEEHRSIAEAMLSGKGDVAARLVEAHLQRGRQLILSPREP